MEQFTYYLPVDEYGAAQDPSMPEFARAYRNADLDRQEREPGFVVPYWEVPNPYRHRHRQGLGVLGMTTEPQGFRPHRGSVEDRLGNVLSNRTELGSTRANEHGSIRINEHGSMRSTERGLMRRNEVHRQPVQLPVSAPSRMRPFPTTPAYPPAHYHVASHGDLVGIRRSSPGSVAEALSHLFARPAPGPRGTPGAGGPQQQRQQQQQEWQQPRQQHQQMPAPPTPASGSAASATQSQEDEERDNFRWNAYRRHDYIGARARRSQPIPPAINALCQVIRGLRQSRQGMPMRRELTSTPLLLNHFTASTATLRRDSPLQEWRRELRLFSEIEWLYLTRTDWEYFAQ